MSSLKISDIGKFTNNITKEQFKSNLHSNEVKRSVVMSTISLAMCVTDILDPTIMGFITGATSANVVNCVHRAYDDALRFGKQYRDKLVQDTIEYKMCKEAYDEYVYKIAQYIRNIGVTDTLDIGMLYMELLYGGFLSTTGEFMYHKFNYDRDFCTPVMGARVASGYAVCRHIASNLVDIYRALGYSACYLSVRGTRCDFMSFIKDRFCNIKTNHAVTLVGDMHGKYIIDPTWGTIALFEETDEFARIIYNDGAIPMYRVDIDGITRRDKDEYDDYCKIRLMRNARIKWSQIRDAQNYAKKYLDAHLFDANSLRFELSDSMIRSANLEHRLSQYSDTRRIDTKKLQKNKKT